VARIGFLHAAAGNAAAAVRAMEAERADATGVHLVDGDLLDAGAEAPDAAARVDGLVDALRRARVDVVVCTCTTVAARAVRAGERRRIPVVRVDEPLARQAARTGGRVLVVGSLASAIAATAPLVEASLGPGGAVERLLVPGAWQAFADGRPRDAHRAVAGAVRGRAGACDTVLLAQLSLAPAAELLGDAGVSVVAGARPAVRAALAALR
jgi:hypothetical protein